MRFRVHASVGVIGSTDLEFEDPSMGTAHGSFVPEKAYESVRSVFRLFAEAQPEVVGAAVDQSRVSEYYRLRDQLLLRLENSIGAVFVPEAIHIEDFFDLEDCMVTVHFRSGEEYDKAITDSPGTAPATVVKGSK